MQLLKPVEVDAKLLVEHLATTLERFRHRTGIQARLACDVDEVDLTPRVCRELAMPRVSGLQALQELIELGLPVRPVLLTAAIDPAETIKALQLGARGVILKESATQLLYTCLQAVMSGEYWVGNERLHDIVQHLRLSGREAESAATPAMMLTRREMQIVAALVEGASNKGIGQQFGLSEQTVKNHISHIFDKVGVSTRLELALYAVHHKLLEGARK